MEKGNGLLKFQLVWPFMSLALFWTEYVWLQINKYVKAYENRMQIKFFLQMRLCKISHSVTLML